ncbi:MAG: FAD-dependent oxidoreductase [Ilumatobacteraceae bacterium]
MAAPRQRNARLARVDVRTGAVVDRITPAALHLRSGVVIATETVVWAAGVKADSLASVLDVEVGAGGRIVVGPDLTIPGHTGAYAVGDIAEIPGRNGALPQVAQVAMQTGRHAARQIRASLEGASLRPFRYRDKGTMATIGRRAAVTELPIGLRLRGTLAWLAWLGLHLLYLAGFRNRISVFLNWAWNYVTWDRGPRLDPRHSRQHTTMRPDDAPEDALEAEGEPPTESQPNR